MHCTHASIAARRPAQSTEASMLCNGYDKVLELAHGDLIELKDARGATVRVTQGTVWLTQEHDTQDVMLRTGDVWTVERQGLTLVEAQGEARVCIVGRVAQKIAAAGSEPRIAVGFAIGFDRL